MENFVVNIRFLVSLNKQLRKFDCFYGSTTNNLESLIANKVKSMYIVIFISLKSFRWIWFLPSLIYNWRIWSVKNKWTINLGLLWHFHRNVGASLSKCTVKKLDVKSPHLFSYKTLTCARNLQRWFTSVIPVVR